MKKTDLIDWDVHPSHVRINNSRHQIDDYKSDIYSCWTLANSSLKRTQIDKLALKN